MNVPGSLADHRAHALAGPCGLHPEPPQLSAPRRAASLRGLLLALAAGSAVLASCASGGGGAPANPVLSDWRPPSGQQCAISSDPATLPAPEDLVDAPALATALQEVFEGAAPAGQVLLSLRQDTAGTWTRVAPIEGSLPEAQRTQVAEALAPHLTRRAVGSVRLLVQADPAGPPRLTVGRSESCGPSISNPDYVATELNRLWREYRREADVQVVVQVSERGRTGTVTLQGSTGHAMLDAQLRALAGRMTFHPALVDRTPLETYVQVPLIIRPRP